jgi:hypothetical protein
MAGTAVPVTHRTAAERAGPARPYLKVLLLAALRAVLSIAAVVTVYYYLPLDRTSTGGAIAFLIGGLLVFAALTVFHVRVITRSRFPGVRAVEALAISIPLFIVLFASTYFVMERLTAASFGVPLTRTDALYFAVTVFATVGFGDITAKTEAARLVVTGQMIADLVFVGVGIKVIVGAVGRGQRRQRGSPDASGGD